MVDNTESSLFIPTVALAAATVVLVGVTAYYAIQTRKTVEEMKKGHEMQFLPFLHVTSNEILNPSGRLRFLIQNIGIGPALQIGINLSLKENEKTATPNNFEFDFLPKETGNTIDFHAGFQPTSNTGDDEQKAREYYRNNSTTVNVELKYKDIFDNDRQRNESIEIKDL